MSTLTIEERFEQFEADYLKFADIANPLHRRADVCAFLMLDSLCPPLDKGSDIIGSAGHDVIYLDVDLDALADNITDEQIRALVRCGVSYDSEYDCLMMFA